jgi:hypothetical protein
MKILAALKREERKLEKHVSKFQHQLDGIRGAMKALGHSAEKEVTKVGRKVRKMSAAGRARIAKAQKLRWKKVKAAAKKAR